MQVHIVNNSILEDEWLKLPYKIYSHCTNRPFMPVRDVTRIFDPHCNSLLNKGKVCRWVIYDDHNLCAGRIASLYIEGRRGSIGFFECKQDLKVAIKLFEIAIEWLREQGCSEVEGPVNFGEKDRFWGLLTDGFHTPGLYLDSHNLPYYQSYFEKFGFAKKDCIYTYSIELSHVPFHKLESINEYIIKKGCYSFRHFCWENEHAFVNDIHSIYTNSFDAGKRVAHISPADIKNMIGQLKPLLNEKYLRVAYLNNKPVGFLMFLCEPTSISSRDKVKVKRLKGFAFAVIPQVRGRGVEIGLCMSLYNQLKSDGGNFLLYLSGINASTVKMHSLIKKLGGKKYKVHETFTYKILDCEQQKIPGA